MPWKECQKMEEKLKCVSRFLDGEKIAALCREFGISRGTSQKSVGRVAAKGPRRPSDQVASRCRHAL
jgi:putative transposase